MTTDEALDLIRLEGFAVNNLFQTFNGWRANLFRIEPRLLWEFANGATPAEALLAALAKTTGPGKPPLLNDPHASAEPGKPARGKINLDDLELEL